MPVLCLIANPNAAELTPSIANSIHREVGGEINWLAQGIACEFIDPKSPDSIAISKQEVGGLSIDVALVSGQERRKKLLVADMDSTMIEQECIDELADALSLKEQVAEITARAMNGELDFKQALDTRVALLKGLELKRVEEVRREQITFTPGGRALIHTMKAYGAYTALVSGGFTYFADHFAKRIGFDEAMANVLEFDGDLLTGKTTGPLVDKDTKLKRLRELAAERELTMDQTLAVGDGANDLPMLQNAGLGVALHAKPAVADQAHVRIDHGDLTALLYLQGYSEEDIVR